MGRIQYRMFTLVSSVLAIAVATGCAADVGQGNNDALDISLEGKEDTTSLVDLGEVPLFRIECDLRNCEYRMTLSEEAPEGAVLVIGNESDIGLWHFSTTREGRLPEEAVNDPFEDRLVRVFERDEETGLLTTSFFAARGERYGFIYAPDAPIGTLVDLTLRLDPPIANNLPIDADGPHDFHITRRISSSSDAWRIPVRDLSTLGNPHVSISLVGDPAQIQMVAYYQCMVDSESNPVNVIASDIGYGSDFTPTCTGTDEGGAIYVEVNGSGNYELAVNIE